MHHHHPTLVHWLRYAHGPLASTLRRAGLSAVGTYAAYVAYGFLHPTLRRGSAGADDAVLPGDELVPAPELARTLAIDIAAPPDAVWPLLVQLGYGRAGWYSWYPLDNGGVESPDGVVPQLQELAVGDVIPDGPRAHEGFGVWRVVELTPPQTLVLYSRRVATTGEELGDDTLAAAPTFVCSWTFAIEPRPGGCRLLARVRANLVGVERGVVASATRWLFDVGDTVMQWTMLDGIRERAEASVSADAAPAARPGASRAQA